METTKHFSDRQNRIDFIKSNIGFGKIIKVCEVDRGHRNGSELHSITTTGIVIVSNKRTSKVVTVLIARPQQIRRYFDNDVPKYLIDIALEHQRNGWNLI